MSNISSTGPKKILLGASQLPGKYNEFTLATAAATPGMNVNRTAAASSNGRDTAAPGASPAVAAATDATASQLHIVLENALVGGTINDAHAVGDGIRTYTPMRGDVLQCLALTGEDIDKEELVKFNAAGKLIAATTGAIGKSLDDSGGALAADTHLRVEFF